jgi:hypothetical protein
MKLSCLIIHQPISLIPSQPIFSLSPYCCVLNGEARNTNCIVFDLTRLGIEASRLPAVKWFDEIILSDYTPANLEAQKQWLNKDKDAADWTQFFKYFSKLDGNE